MLLEDAETGEQTDRQYFAESEHDLRSIYENLATRLVMRAEKQELTWGLAGIAIILLLCAATPSMLWFNRVV